MKRVTFADSSGWYAMIVPDDANHAIAVEWMRTNTGEVVTTDYVFDETLTLLRSRGYDDLAQTWGQAVLAGQMGTLYYLTPADVAAAWGVFHRFADKDWSFTDCSSKVVMEAKGIAVAFAFDHHFRQFGTVAVVP